MIWVRIGTIIRITIFVVVKEKAMLTSMVRVMVRVMVRIRVRIRVRVRV